MAGNTRPLKRAVDGVAPQYFNPTADDYEYLLGRNGANRVELYGPDGTPLSTTSGKLNVRASEIEALAGALTDAAVTDPAASATVIALLKGLLKQHQGGGTIKDQVDVIDRAARVLGKITADDAAITALGALAAAAITDPTASASVIALLKGLLKQLQGTGAGAAPVQLTGSIMQPTDYTTTDTMATAFTFDNLLESALITIKNIGANGARLNSYLYLDGTQTSISYYPYNGCYVPPGTTLLLPVAMFKKVRIDAMSDVSGNPTTLSARLKYVSSPAFLKQPWLIDWITPDVAAGAGYVPSALPTFGASKIAVRVYSSAAHTFTAKLAWLSAGAEGAYFMVDTIPDGTNYPNAGKHGVFDVKMSHVRIWITNNDTVSHTYSVKFLLLP